MDNNFVLSGIETDFEFHVKDPISAFTHFIGFVCAIFSMPFLLIHASMHGQGLDELISLSVFMVSMALLYGASTSYHTFHISEKIDKRLKKLDHMMIFVLIAGTYTPVCMIPLREGIGIKLLVLIWAVALLGIGFKALWVTCPRWVSSVIYISMGWLAILAIKPLFYTLSESEFIWLLAGGIIYTIGGVVYAMKLPILEKYFSGFGAHELFHIFVLLGSLCHFLLIYSLAG